MRGHTISGLERFLLLIVLLVGSFLLGALLIATAAATEQAEHDRALIKGDLDVMRHQMDDALHRLDIIESQGDAVEAALEEDP